MAPKYKCFPSNLQHKHTQISQVMVVVQLHKSFQKRTYVYNYVAEIQRMSLNMRDLIIPNWGYFTKHNFYSLYIDTGNINLIYFSKKGTSRFDVRCDECCRTGKEILIYGHEKHKLGIKLSQYFRKTFVSVFIIPIVCFF